MEFKEEDYLLLSGIQHFMFCRRQWAIIHIEQEWTENTLTAEGRIVHDRVHESNIIDSRNGILTIRGLYIKSEKLGMTGICDAVEFIPSENGIALFGKNGFWNIRPVEYKRGKTKFNDCDRLQTVAQVICLEEMFSCRINEAHIFYNETRHREKFEITDEYREKVFVIASEMHQYFSSGTIPKVKYKKSCDNCSIRNICLPELLKNKENAVAVYIGEHK